MTRHETSVSEDILIGMGAGLLANLAVGVVDGLLSRLISAEQKAREAAVREASPHDLAGKVLARKLAGRAPSPAQTRLGKVGVTLAYGMFWGAAYALVRRKLPGVSRAAGLPFAVPFFFLCDGMIAPRLKLTPPLRRVPWQPNAKELANHAAWTAAAELTMRAVAR